MKGGVFMTDLEKIKAAKAAYAREWRKRNPERAKEIQKRYWKKSYFDAVDLLKEACISDKVTLVEAAYRWLAYHSMLRDDRGDGIIIGASKLTHLKQNLEAMKKGPLPGRLTAAFEQAWELCRADSPEYFTLYKQG